MSAPRPKSFYDDVSDFFSGASGAVQGVGSILKNAPYFIAAALAIAGLVAVAEVKSAFSSDSRK